MSEKEKVTIKTASAITGLTIKAIRYYEKRGLIKPVGRTESGYRLYSKQDIYRLQRIQFYKEMKFSLEEIGEIILSGEEKPSQEMLSRQVEKIQREIENDKRVEMMLRSTLFKENEGGMHCDDSNERKEIAVIGIDLQNDLKMEGALPCRRFYSLFDVLAEFYKEMRELNIPIIYVCDCHHKGDEELNIWADHMMEGTWGEQIIDELRPEPQDYIVKKSYFNGFIHTDLQELLLKLKVRTLMFTGWRTHVCVTQTAIEAFHRNYRVIVARDGVNSTTKKEHEFGIDLLDANYGFETYTCAEIIRRLKENDIV